VVHKQPGDLRLGGIARHDMGERVACLIARKVLPPAKLEENVAERGGGVHVRKCIRKQGNGKWKTQNEERGACWGRFVAPPTRKVDFSPGTRQHAR
jgi:hypothetical protein